MITGVPSDETVNRAMIFGAYDYIAKPFGKEKIYFIMERAVSYRKVLLAAHKKP
jgi:DNA-binding NtrC family response regulator